MRQVLSTMSKCLIGVVPCVYYVDIIIIICRYAI